MRRHSLSFAEKTALSTFTKLMRSSESVAADVHRELGGHGLSVSQFGILEALYHLGPLCQKELASKILKSAGNITLVIDNLEKQKLVVRKRDMKDRRYYVVSLTSKGKELMRDIFPSHAARITERMSCLSDEEQEALGRLLKKLGKPDTAEGNNAAEN